MRTSVFFELLGVGLAGGHAEPVAERAGGGGNARRLVVGMGAEPPVRLAVIVEILARQNALLLEDDILDHAAMTLRHQEHVAIVAVGLAAHEIVVDQVGDLDAGECGRHVQRGDLLRDVEDADAIGPAPLARGGGVEAVAQYGCAGRRHAVVHGSLTPARCNRSARS